MRATRYVLFGIAAATILGSIALIIFSNVNRGPTQTYELVAVHPASLTDLRTDAAAIVRRLAGTGYSTAQAQVSGTSIQVVLYGSRSSTRAALIGAIAQDRIFVRPVECAAPENDDAAPGAGESGPVSCGRSYLLTADALKVDTKTGKPTAHVGTDPDLAAVASTPLATESGSQPALVQAGEYSGFAGDRLVVGVPAFDNSAIASASDQSDGSEWTVQLTLTTKGSEGYDALAQRQFHAYIAIELDGSVLDAQLVEPTNCTFVTLGGTLDISGKFTNSEAVELADNITSPLVVPLALVG
jgi:hypothetical protein